MRSAAAITALVFVTAFFAVPLYAAMSLCVMPCCMHPQQATAVSSGMAGCATPCAVSADETTEPAATTLVPQRTMSVVVTLTPVALAAAVAAPDHVSYASTPPRAADAPLHVLNSTFRI